MMRTADQLVALGPLAAVATRYLATRPDLLPDFEKWLAPAAAETDLGMSPSEIREAVTAGLQRDADHAFKWIDPTPLSQNRLRQFHRARTPGDVDVVLILRRPDAAKTVVRESPSLLSAIRRLANRAGVSSAETSILERGLQEWLAVEADASRELENIRRLLLAGPDYRTLGMPRPIAALCGEHLITLEAELGIPFDDLTGMTSDKGRRPRHLFGLDIDPTDLGNNFLRALLQQMFGAGWFVSDFNPETLVALRGSRPLFLDLCHVERTDPVVLRNQYRYVVAMLAFDSERIVSGLDGFLEETSRRDSLEAFRTEFRRLLQGWQREREHGHDQEKGVGDWFVESLKVARKHSLSVAPPLATMARTLALAEETVKRLTKRVGLETAARDFYALRWMPALGHEMLRERLPSLGFDLVDLVTDTPGNLVRILSDVADRRFLLRVQTVESVESLRAGSTRVRLLATAILFLGSCVLAAALWLGPPASFAIWAVVLALALGSLVLFVALWRRLR